MFKTENSINVGLGQIAIAKPPQVLVSIGVGSCVVVCIYDARTKTAGMAHIMLPGRNETHPPARSSEMPAKYADSAIENLLREFRKMKITDFKSLSIRIVGGAQLFKFKQVPNIGEKNIRAIREALRKRGLRITAEEVGGNVGRSVWFIADSGKIIVRSKLGEKILP